MGGELPQVRGEGCRGEASEVRSLGAGEAEPVAQGRHVIILGSVTPIPGAVAHQWGHLQ